MVTKKKKSKKRRSSLSSRRQTYSREEHVGDFNRVPSPELRRKSAISVPHSEKSNDSSDVDSVHSLPIDANRLNIDREDEDGVNFPISYADIAKNSTNQLDKPKWNRPASDKKKNPDKKTADKAIPTSPDSDGSKNEVFLDKIPKKKTPDDKIKVVKQVNNTSPQQPLQIPPKTQDKATSIQEDKSLLLTPTMIKQQSPPELTLVNYMANFPSIPSREKNNTNEQQPKIVKNVVAEIQNWPAIPSNNYNNNVNNGKGFDKNNVNRINTAAQNQQKNQRNLANHFKNAKNVAVHTRHDKQQINLGNNNMKTQIIYTNEAQVSFFKF